MQQSISGRALTSEQFTANARAIIASIYARDSVAEEPVATQMLDVSTQTEPLSLSGKIDTVEPRYNESKSSGNLPIMDLRA